LGDVTAFRMRSLRKHTIFPESAFGNQVHGGPRRSGWPGCDRKAWANRPPLDVSQQHADPHFFVRGDGDGVSNQDFLTAPPRRFFFKRGGSLTPSATPDIGKALAVALASFFSPKAHTPSMVKGISGIG